MRAALMLSTILPMLACASKNTAPASPSPAPVLAYAVEGGVALTGYSYMDEWIRISDDDGRGGWIFRGQVARR